VDSSSVAALMNEVQRPVTTCSIGFHEQGYDESQDAGRFARSLEANHFEHIVKPKALEVIAKLAWHYDEPFADSSAVPTYYVSKLARQHVTVALSGDGGDENFAGYRRYYHDQMENRIRAILPAGVRRMFFGPLGHWYPKLGWAPRIFRAKSVLQSVARSPMEGYFFNGTLSAPGLKQKILGGDVWKTLNGYDSIEVVRYHYQRANTADLLSAIQYVDIKTYLVDDILVKVDRASMANSLEVRCPLLDHKVMELIARIPSTLKLHNGTGKYIFKRALDGVLPPDILYRRKKGFAVPVAEWFRGELKEFAHETMFARRDELLNERFLKSCWTQHQCGQRDWSALLWAVLMFRTWQEAYRRA
jgi:asparagine synthase (glutamine-hydrolysing)